MPHYKSTDNKIYFLDSADFEHLLPVGSIQITDAEAITLSPVLSPNEIIRQQIIALESTITQRRLREAMLSDAGKSWLVNVDSQIIALRATLV